MPEVLLSLPHPTYCVPRQWFTLRRIRRRQIPVPRRPVMHFSSDFLSQQLSAVENSDQGPINAVYEIWSKMSNEQRMPWIQMTEMDKNVIAQLVPYYAECLRRGRQIASRPTDGGPANQKPQVVGYLTLSILGSFIPVGPQTLLPPIVLFHERRPVASVQPVIVFNQTRCRPCTCFYDSSAREDNPRPFSEVAPISSGPELPVLEANRAHYATPMRSTYQSQAQDTNHDQHEEINSSNSTETQDNSSNSPDEKVEVTFLEAQRNRYATPVRTTYYPSFMTGSTAD